MAEIAPLTAGDVGPWSTLRLALWPEAGDLEELAAEIEALLDDPAQAAFGIFAGGTLVGFAEVRERAYGDGCLTAPVAWLEGIYLAPGHEGKGHARALVQNCEAWARQRGLTEIGSDAAITNHHSIARHGQWGFLETGRVVQFRKEL